MDSVDWHAVPPLLNLLAHWAKEVHLKKKKHDFASLCELLVGQVDWLGELALESDTLFLTIMVSMSVESV